MCVCVCVCVSLPPSLPLSLPPCLPPSLPPPPSSHHLSQPLQSSMGSETSHVRHQPSCVWSGAWCFQLFCMAVRPGFPYSCPDSPPTGLITGCLRVILGEHRWDNKRNTEIHSQAGMERVEVMLLERRLHWLGHIERMEDSHIPKCLLVCRPAHSKRSVSGQKRRWNDIYIR